MIGKLLRRWFRPRKLPVPPVADRDWLVGDVAQCLVPADGWRSNGVPTYGPDNGEMCRVVAVGSDGGTVWPCFAEYRPGRFYAGYFRKLRKSTCDIFALASKPKKVAA